jgi:hypothetical protein
MGSIIGLVIREWQVETVLGASEVGRSRALILHCRSDSDTRDLLVKTVDTGITDTGLFCEFFGNIVAREIGLSTPEPALVAIDASTAAMINAAPIVRAKGKKVDTGTGVGCEYIRPAPLPARTSGLSAAQLEEAALIYSYDLLVHHPDRRITNPNVFLFKERFIAIDFDLTFSFLWDIFGSIPAWEVSKLKFVSDHFFFKLMRDSKIPWGEVLPKALSYDADKLDVFVQKLPERWHDHGRRVIDHLRLVKDHETEFRWELLRTVS